jgi:homoserine O-acetyltransferase
MPGYEVPARRWISPEPLRLEGGATLPSFELAYETWGELNKAHDNAVVVFHALSGSSHAFASDLDPSPGWWDGLLAPDSPIHPGRSFIICANLLGGCYGSTGPSSLDPRTATRPGARFPQVTTGDMIEAQRRLLRALGVDKPITAIGGSLGGMLALEWAVKYPDEVANALALVSPGKSYAQTIAFRAVQREAILADPAWKGGDYYDGPHPERGLTLARKIGMITYRSWQEFEVRYGRNERDPRLHFLEGQFEVQSYLDHVAKKWVARFDANTYLYFSRAMDLFDLSRGHGSFEEAAARVTARTLLLAVDTDFLCPLWQVRELHEAFVRARRDVELAVIRSNHGHDSFLIEMDEIQTALRRFLRC